MVREESMLSVSPSLSRAFSSMSLPRLQHQTGRPPNFCSTFEQSELAFFELLSLLPVT